MSQRSNANANANAGADVGRTADDYYLPGGPAPSTTPGPVERIFRRLFRRRGRF
ncbi:MAG: hypothetical protein ABEH58_03670 [Haloplanus sp.]